MLAVLRNLELIVLVVALPVFAVADWPLAGWGVGAAVWIAWRVLGAYLDRRAMAVHDDIGRFAVIQGASAIGRGWVLLLGILAAGLLISREVAFAAAILCTVLFTVSISLRFVTLSFARSADTKPSAT